MTDRDGDRDLPEVPGGAEPLPGPADPPAPAGPGAAPHAVDPVDLAGTPGTASTGGTAAGAGVPHEPTDDEVDRTFADLVAALDLDRPVRWPGQKPAGPAPTSAPGTAVTAPVAGGPRDFALADDEDDGGFRPPEPAPLGGGDRVITLAWCLAVGGPVLLVLALVLWPAAPTVVWAAALVAALAGVTVLVWRMPRRRDPDDHDDGAVV